MSALAAQLKAVFARNSLTTRRRKAVVRRFAEKLDFVYFGRVDQHVDDHHIVRGFSVSPSHEDFSYTVGTYEGYDVTLVDRLDVDRHDDGTFEKHRWLICEVELHTAKDIPHFFLLPNHHSGTHYHKVFTALRYLDVVPTEVVHSVEFTSRYTVYSSHTHAIELEQYLTTEVTNTVAAHFWPLAIEVFEGRVYFYSAEQKLTMHELEAMLKNSTWFVQVLTQLSQKD